MQSLSFAASTHSTNVASQLYLWIVSRIDMSKLVQRSIQAVHGPVKMVLAEYRYEDRLPQGIPIHTAMRVYGGPALASLIVPGTQAYIRRKPTANCLSADTYQLVIQWNAGIPRPANSNTVRPPALEIPPVPAHIARGPPSPVRPPAGSPRPLFNSPAHTPTATSDVEDFQNATE